MATFASLVFIAALVMLLQFVSEEVAFKIGFVLAFIGALVTANFFGKWAAEGPLRPLRDWLVRRLG